MSIRLLIGFVLFLVSAASQIAGGEIQTLEQIADQVIAKHMAGKEIPGLSLAIVHRGQTLLARADSLPYEIARAAFDAGLVPD